MQCDVHVLILEGRGSIHGGYFFFLHSFFPPFFFNLSLFLFIVVSPFFPLQSFYFFMIGSRISLVPQCLNIYYPIWASEASHTLDSSIEISRVINILLHDWEGNTGKYSVRDRPYRHDHNTKDIEIDTSTKASKEGVSSW